MKQTLITAAIAAAGLAWTAVALAADNTAQPAATQPAATQAADLHSQASYAIGFDFGKQLKENHVPVDVDMLMQGIRDQLAGTASKLTPEQYRDAMTQLQTELAANAEAAQKTAGAEAQKGGDAFRADNAKKPGVKVTTSGLQIETIKEGTGASPTAADTVKVHYTGKLIDGTTFDSSVDRGQPIEFPLSGVIPGWTEGLQLMKVGGKSRLVIPPELGYGPRGEPRGGIPPNATLVFEVELLDIKKK